MKKKKEPEIDMQVEKSFEIMWKNLDSRRRCEKTHVPEFFKKKQGKD